MTASSTPSSNYTKMEQQIESLTQTVNDLQQQLKTLQGINTKIIAEAVQTAINDCHNCLEQQYKKLHPVTTPKWNNKLYLLLKQSMIFNNSSKLYKTSIQKSSLKLLKQLSMIAIIALNNNTKIWSNLSPTTGNKWHPCYWHNSTHWITHNQSHLTTHLQWLQQDRTMRNGLVKIAKMDPIVLVNIWWHHSLLSQS